MIEQVSQFGIAGIVALLILKEVFSFLSKRNGNGKTVQDWRISNLETSVIQLTKSMEERNKLTGIFISKMEALTKSIDNLVSQR